MRTNDGARGDSASDGNRAAGGATARLPRGGGPSPSSWDLAIIDMLPGAVYACEAPSGLIVRYNRRAAELWGREPVLGIDGERFCGSFRIYRPDGTPLPHDQCPMAIALREGRVVQGEEIIVERPDGARFHVLPEPVPLFGESGEVVGAVNTLVDVTERRRAGWERNLLAAIVESTDDAIVSKSLDGIITSWNRAAERIFGYAAAEVVGRSIAVIVPPEQGDDVARILDLIRRGERIDHYETRRRRKDGLIIDVALTISPVRDDTGKIIGASKVARDITERRRVEQERDRLLAAEQRITEKLRRLADVAARLTIAHEIAAVMRILAEEARDLIGAHRAAASLAVDEDWARAIDSAQSAGEYARWGSCEEPPGLRALVCGRNQPMRLAQGELEAHPAWCAGAGGPHPPLRGWLAAPLVERDGRNLGLVQLSDKIRGEFTAEDESVLVQLAQMASVAIENARLYQELRANDRRKDEFLAMLAHELRNPLSAISNAVRLFQAGDLGGEDFEWGRDVIARQVKQLSGIIDDLLDVSRITQGKIQLRREDVDLRPIINHAVEVVGPLVEERKHRLTVSFPPGPIRLHADPLRIEQILINLLINAAKYTESGGRIELSAAPEGGDVVISVRDNGIGISPELLPQMFDLFAQGVRGLSRSEGGLGIGLTLVRKLAEMHGGSVAARSKGSGTGSEFIIRIPAATMGREAQSPDGAGSGAKLTASRVLIVDDNVDAARGMARLLGVLGYEVRIAHDGHEAIEAARVQAPEFVLLDIGLPGMDGYEVAGRLRAGSVGAGPAIIAISGYGQEDDRRRTREAGFDHHLVKPVDYDALLALLAAKAGC